MKRLSNSQEGSALVTAVLAIMFMMMLGLAAMAAVDGQSDGTGKSRVQESSFNASEAVLSAQSFVLAGNWPGSATTQMPTCTYSGGTVSSNPAGAANRCPDASSLNQTLTGTDFQGGNLTWTVEAYDNKGTEPCTSIPQATCSTYWNDAARATLERWDENQDSEMWVRAQAILRGKRRTVLGRVRVTKTSIQLPNAAVTAGSFQVAGGGPKQFLKLNGGMMQLRCNIADTACLKLHKSSNIGYPGTVQGYPTFDDGGRTLNEEQLDLLRTTATQNGTYFPAGSCPSTAAQYSGAVVFIENGNCQLTGNGTINTAAKPGLIVVRQGSIKFTGTKTIYGTIYMANAQGATGTTILDLGGNSTVIGSIFIDGQGGLSVTGSTKVVYDPNAQQNISSVTGSGLVRSSFRELDAPAN